MSRRYFLLIFLTLGIILPFVIMMDWLPGLRGQIARPEEWIWPYYLRPVSQWLAPTIAAGILLIISAWWLTRLESSRKSTIVGLLGLFAGCLLLQMAIVFADGNTLSASLVNRTLSFQTNGYFRTAAEIEDLDDTLRLYPMVMPLFESEHVRTHPPGLIIANWLTIQAFSKMPEVSQWVATQITPLRCADHWLLNQPPKVTAALGFWAYFPLVLAASTVFPAWLLSRRLGNGTATLLGTTLVATLPAILLFAPLPDQMFALLATITFAALVEGVLRRSPYWLALAGLTLSLNSFLSLGNAMLLLAAIIFLGLVFGISRTTNPKKTLALILAFLGGTLSLWVIYWIGWGVEPWSVATTGLEQHYQLVTSRRSYSLWLGRNLLDLLLFAGPIVIAGFLGAVGNGIFNLRRRRLAITDALALGLATMILALSISGSTRGEVGRLWLFFMPLMAIVGQGFLDKGLKKRHWVILAVALQIVLAIAIGIAWRSVEPVIVVAERPQITELAGEKVMLETSFEGGINLTGFTLPNLKVQPGDSLRFMLYWQAGMPADKPYTVFTHLLNERGEIAAQQDNWPMNGKWPPTCWERDDTINDPFEIDLPADLPAGVYTLIIGLYDATTGSRLLTEEGQDNVWLTDISINLDP